MMSWPVLETRRLIIRPLRIDDVNQRYLSWFGQAAADHIVARRTTHTLEDLKAYVADKVAQPDVMFLAIIDRETLSHIGNVKFEPVDRQGGYAVFGILIGDGGFRGQGVAGEVIASTSAWLKKQGIREILLGVNVENTAAIRAYEKAGFHIGSTPRLSEQTGVHRMILTL